MRVFRQRSRLEREVVVPVLVAGSLVLSIVASVAAGAERPYPGFALGSGLVLVLERAAIVWAFVLLALVIVDLALRGRLPVEISGRGVRYAPEEQFDGVVHANDDVSDRLDGLEAALEALRQPRVES